MTKTAFVFPGQGSQSLAMLADLASYPVVAATFTEASSAIGYDVWELVQRDPEARLNQTEYTQVAMLTADVAVYRLLLQQGIPAPKMMAGHSLGEYAALVCAEAISLGEAVCLVARRGYLMQHAVPLGAGAMAAIIGLSDEQVSELCGEASQTSELVSPANFNALGQVVVAGHLPAVQRAITLAEKAGALLAKIIPVSVPCHCPLLTNAAQLFAADLEQTNFNTPRLDVVSNVDVSIYSSPLAIKEKLKAQLYSPVRWVETIQLFKNKHIEKIVECGPGKVLAGLIKRIDRQFITTSVYDANSLDSIVEQFHISI